jgi:orotate phosphoribosyltransferase-like protein
LTYHEAMNNREMPTIDVKKYGGKQVAIADGKIVASGTTLKEVIEKVKLKMPTRPLREIHIFSVPKTLSVI